MRSAWFLQSLQTAEFIFEDKTEEIYNEHELAITLRDRWK